MDAPWTQLLLLLLPTTLDLLASSTRRADTPGVTALLILILLVF